MCPSVCIFTSGFNTMVLHHIAVMKRVSGCPEIILDARLVMDRKLKFSGLHAYLT
jgi:hypothetical protein